MNPYFSIIIPVYNVAPYLRECLDSVLAQTYTDWEAICVDDGSTDGSGGILDEYANKDTRFRIIHQSNVGVSEARNAALAIARGEYIAFVDADDAVEPNWLQFASNLLSDEPDIGMMACARWYGGNYESARQTKVERFDTQEQVLKFFINHVYGYTPFLFFCRRDVLRGLRFDRRLKRDEDVAYFSLVFLRAHSMVNSDYAGYLYRQREDSADHTHVNDIDDAKFIDVAKENYLALNCDGECSCCYREWLSRRVIFDVWARCANGRFSSRNTVKALRSALRAGSIDSQYVPISRRIFVGLISQFGVLGWYACSLMFSVRNLLRKLRKNKK